MPVPQNDPDGTPTRPGPKAETLKIEGDPEEAIRRILNVRKPPNGWPKPNGNGNHAKKRGGK